MKRKMMVSLLVLMIAVIFNTTTFAQVTPDASTSPQTKRPAFFQLPAKGDRWRVVWRGDGQVVPCLPSDRLDRAAHS